MKGKNKFHPRQLVKAKQSCSLDVDGTPYTFNSKSQPVKADHPAVQSNPELFEPVDPEFDAGTDKPRAA
jgi:hypothetical protein